MKTVIEMAREAGFQTGTRDYADGNGGQPFVMPIASGTCLPEIERLVELVRADEREQIAQMIEAAPPLVQLAQNEHGGCLMCGFTPRLAAASIRARVGNT